MSTACSLTVFAPLLGLQAQYDFNLETGLAAAEEVPLAEAVARRCDAPGKAIKASYGNADRWPDAAHVRAIVAASLLRELIEHQRVSVSLR